MFVTGAIDFSYMMVTFPLSLFVLPWLVAKLLSVFAGIPIIHLI